MILCAIDFLNKGIVMR